jgi:hypothetical protein
MVQAVARDQLLEYYVDLTLLIAATPAELYALSYLGRDVLSPHLNSTWQMSNSDTKHESAGGFGEPIRNDLKDHHSSKKIEDHTAAAAVAAATSLGDVTNSPDTPRCSCAPSCGLYTASFRPSMYV